MFWGDKAIEQIKEAYEEKIASKTPLRIRDEKTASGRVHVGSLRGVVVHGILADILSEQKIANTFLYEINDFDPMDGLPVYLDRERFLPYMGKPLVDIPSPDNRAKNYAEYFGGEFVSVIEELGFTPEFYRSSELYRAGKYNDVIRTVLQNAAKIREIYRRVSGSVKDTEWLPLQVVCERCGNIGTTKVISFDGNEVEYVCEEHLVKWAKGCNHRGKVSPFDGRSKLPWKVEWAAKFTVLSVDIEGGGKDHSTKGGARDIANTISREVFHREPPFDIPYEFLTIGGRKMSSSKGAGSSAREIADLLPPTLFRFLILSKDIKQAIDFVPDGESIPVLYDLYDTYAEKYWSGADDDYSRIFSLAHPPSERERIPRRFLPRFSQVAFLVQMPHILTEDAVAQLKGAPLTEEDKEELKKRVAYARKWLAAYAPEDYRYELQEKEAPAAVHSFSSEQKQALNDVLIYVRSQKELDGQALHSELHEIRKRSGLEPKLFFVALYQSFLGKNSGPKAGWFFSVLPREFLEKRLAEAAGENFA